MTLFEGTLGLLIVAVLLLQVSRRLGTPYPAMLALSGACVAVFPWVPKLVIEPRLALTLFVARALLDAAYEQPRANCGGIGCRWWRWCWLQLY